MINGVRITELKKNEDARGWLAEIYRLDDSSISSTFIPSMGYVSATKPGVIRGPHEHEKQSDLFVFLGKFRLYLWDNRKASRTYGEKMEIGVSGEELMKILVPPGVVHGYKCTGETYGVVLNFPDRLYGGYGRKEPVDEIRWEKREDNPFKIE